MVKKIAADKARKIANKPKSSAGPTLLCKSKTGALEYLVVPGPKEDQFTLWLKDGKSYLEIAVSDSPNEFEDIIEWEK